MDAARELSLVVQWGEDGRCRECHRPRILDTKSAPVKYSGDQPASGRVAARVPREPRARHRVGASWWGRTPTRSTFAAISSRSRPDRNRRERLGWVAIGWGRTPNRLTTAWHPRYGCEVIRGLDHAQIAAPPGCEAAARDFFGRDLGLAEISAKPSALLPQGGVWFALADGRELHIGVETTFAPQEKAHLAFAMTSAAKLTELAARCG